MKTLGITGLRPQKLPWGFNENDSRCIQLREKLSKYVKKFQDDGYTRFITGMALGPDIWFAEDVINLPEPRILECYCAFRGQENGWSNPDYQDRYHDILNEANFVKYCSKGYSSGVYLERDKKLVDECDMMIAIWDGQTEGGTQSTVIYARQKNIPVLMINPKEFWT